jgi:hypothetical protein
MPNTRKIEHSEIIAALLSDLGPSGDRPIDEIVIGGHLAAVRAGRTGLASRIRGHGRPGPGDVLAGLPDEYSRSARTLARALAGTPADPSQSPPRNIPQLRTLAVAAVNALLPPPENAPDVKGQDLLLKRARGKNVAVVGHFPFVERLRDEFAGFTVLELNPRQGDLPASRADDILPRADAVAVTSTTIMNGALGPLLSLIRPGAFVIMLGPSTPFAPSLFDFGVNALSGSVVIDPAAALAGIRADKPYRKLAGVQPLTVQR